MRKKRTKKQQEQERARSLDDNAKIAIGEGAAAEWQACGFKLGPRSGAWYSVPCFLTSHGGPDKNFSAGLCVEPATTDSGVSLPGHFICHKCPKGENAMNILQWMAKATGKSEGEIENELAERYKFRHLYTKKDKKARDLPPEKKVEPIPDAKTLERYKEALWNTEAGQKTANYFNRRGITNETMVTFEFGFNNYRLVIIRRNEKGEVINLWFRTVEENDPRAKGPIPLAGQPKLQFPANLGNLTSQKLIICEGFIDVITLWQLGEKTAFTMGGTTTNEYKHVKSYLPTGDGSIVYVAQDNDAPGRKTASGLINGIMKDGEVETVLNITEALPLNHDISSYLSTAQDEEHKKEMWQRLVDKSLKRSIHDRTALGITEVQGQLMWADANEVLAPFTGEVIRCGIEKLGSARGATVYTIKLKHVSGETLTVNHKMGTSFEQSVQNSFGMVFLFKFELKFQDKILTFIIQGADHKLQQRDIGWIFGYDCTNGARNLDNFYTPGLLFTPQGPVQQDRLEIQAPHALFDRVRIPNINSDTFRDAIRLLWEHVYPCHRADVMGPLLASAFLAPVREKFFPFLPRFPVLVYGPSGSGKTSRCRLVQSLFGDFRADTDMLSWRSTYKAIEHLTGMAGDMWLLVDEMQIEKMNKESRMEAMEFLKSIPQGLGRAKMKMSGDGLQGMPQPPTSIIALTMEVMPIEDEGLLSRCLLVKVPKTNLWDSTLRWHTESTWRSIGMLPLIMSGWIETFTASNGWFQRTIDARLERSREFCNKTLKDECPFWTAIQNAPRLVNRLEVLTAVWYSVIQMSYNAEAIDKDKADALREEWEKVIKDIIVRGVTAYQSSGLERSFLDVVASGLQSGHYHLEVAGKLSRDFGGDPIPATRTANSKLIGYFKKSREQSEHSISYRSQHIEIALASSSAALFGRDAQNKWRIAIEYMRNEELLREISRAGKSRKRVIWLTKKGAEMLMEGVEGIEGVESADQASES